LRARLLQTALAFRLLWRRPDIVHFQSISRGRDLYFVRLLLLLRFRVFCTAHDLLPHDSTSVREREAHGHVYRIVDRVIVHAEDNRRELVELFGVDPERIRVVPHGSYDLLLPEGQMSKPIARRRAGLPEKGRIVLFFGLIKRYKGLEFLVEAFRRVETRIPDALLVVVGDVFRTDPEGHAFYWRLIEEISKWKNVRCVPEYIPIDRIGPYLSSADVVVLPYTKTYQSGVLLSAYAAGRPVVVTETGGLPETVVRGKTGLVVPPRDSDALAAAIEQILNDPESAEAMGKAASRLAETVYSWDTIAKQTIELYRSRIGPRRPPKIRQPLPAAATRRPRDERWQGRASWRSRKGGRKSSVDRKA
jgi:glycosyltransferase involved in cell wall biosynthesis